MLVDRFVCNANAWQRDEPVNKLFCVYKLVLLIYAQKAVMFVSNFVEKLQIERCILVRHRY